MKPTILMIKSLLMATLTAALVLFIRTAAWSHGVEGYMEQMDGHCLTAQYDDGEPMSYAAVEIKAPASDAPFQTGRTDRNGRFMFLTDMTGSWKAVVNDGMGHQLTLDLDVSGDRAAEKRAEVSSPTASGKSPRLIRAIDGLAIIFGLCGLLYGWKSGKR